MWQLRAGLSMRPPSQARRVYICQNDINDHGYTKNCPKCHSIIVYGPNAQSSILHSEECRQRVMVQ